MKIARIETFLFFPGEAKNLLFVRVETDDGLHGWGEAYTMAGKEKVVAAYIDAIVPALLGRDSGDIRRLTRQFVDEFVIRRVSGDFQSAWSAIEIALWDILGKRAGLPLHRLLGGAVRTDIPVYANGWWWGASGIEEIVSRALAVVAQGYTALKWDPIPKGHSLALARADEERAIANVRALRQAVGPEVKLLIDGHRRLAPSDAIRLSRRFASFDIGWYEEPCPPGDPAWTARVRRDTTIPVVAGETCATQHEMLRLLDEQAADIVNPDICIVGGVAPMLEIAAMADLRGVLFSPHNFNSTVVGLTASLHVAAVAHNLSTVEVFVNLEPSCAGLADVPWRIHAGLAAFAGGRPGLGIDLDLTRLRKSPYRDFGARRL